MTNEQLTQSIMDLTVYKAKAEEEHDMFKSMLKTMRDDIKATKTLTEDVHIMAINMQNMQKTLEETKKKVDALSSQEFIEYKENKKVIKQNIINKIVGFVLGIILTFLAFKLGLKDFM